MAIERLARLGGRAGVDDASKIIHEGMNEEEGEDDEIDADEETKSNQVHAMAMLESSTSNLTLVGNQMKSPTPDGTDPIESMNSSSVEQIDVRMSSLQQTADLVESMESSLENIVPPSTNTTNNNTDTDTTTITDGNNSQQEAEVSQQEDSST